MINVLYALVAALALSITGNVWLFKSRDHAIADAATAATATETANRTAEDCGKSVDALKQQAEIDQKAHEVQIAEALKENMRVSGEGQQILMTAPSTPGNQCKSIDDLLLNWHKGRKLQ